MNNTNSDQHLRLNLADDDSIDIKRYLSLFINNWYWFAITLLMAIAVAYAKNRYSEKIYTITSSLLIKDVQFGGGTGDITKILPGTTAFKSEQNLKNEVGILKSFNLNQRVMKDLPDFHVTYLSVGRRGIAETRLYKNAPFIVQYDSLEKQRTGVKIYIKIVTENTFTLEINGKENFSTTLSFGQRFNEMGFDFTLIPRTSSIGINPASPHRYYFYFESIEGLANLYRNKLSILPIEKEATLVTLSVSGPVPAQEADYLNKLMDLYLQQGLDVKNETADKTIEFIDTQIGSVSDSLRVVESNLENFRLSNRLVNMSQEGTFIQNRLQSLENERNTMILQKHYYKYLQEYIAKRNETGDIISPGTMGVENGPLERLVEELASLQQQKKRLQVNISSDLPAITIIDEGIKQTKALLAENINSSMKSLENAINEADRRILTVEGDLYKLPGTERRLINIQRKFDLNNTVYNYLLEKKAEAGIAKASTVSDNRIIDYARPANSSQIAPRSRQNFSMALIFGIFIPMFLILIIDLMNNKIIDRKDIEKRTSVPVIGFISHNSLTSELPVEEKPGSTLAESFRSLRTNLKYFIRETSCPVISVSSTISSEGKTFISSNLAAIIAKNGMKVLLVGLDLRKPGLHKILEVPNDKGISSYLIGEDKLQSIIISTKIKNLWYVPSGPVPPNPAELIDSAEMRKFIDEAKKQFDSIVIDTPPVAMVTDALMVSPFTDLYIFVVRQRFSSKNTVELIEELNRRDNLKAMGIVLNDISLSGYYGYGLRYGYNQSYGYHYGYNYYGNNGKYGKSEYEKGYYTDD